MTRILLCILAGIVCSYSAAVADQCRDVLANGVFEHDEKVSSKYRADSFVDYLLSDAQFIKFMQSSSDGSGSVEVPAIMNASGGGSSANEAREEMRKLLVGYREGRAESFEALATYSKKASDRIVSAWENCMTGLGLKLSFKTTPAHVAFTFSYDTGGPNSRAYIEAIRAEGSITDCKPDKQIAVGRGRTSVICNRGDGEGIITVDASDFRIVNSTDNIFIVPAKVKIEDVLSKPSNPRLDPLNNYDPIALRFTHRGDWFLENAGPGDRIRTTPKTESDLQSALDFHTFIIIKVPGSSSKGPKILSGDVIQFQGTTSGHRAMKLDGGRLIAAKDEGQELGTRFRIIAVHRSGGEEINSGDYIRLQESTAGGWLTHDPNGPDPQFPDFAAGSPGALQEMFIRRPKG